MLTVVTDTKSPPPALANEEDILWTDARMVMGKKVWLINSSVQYHLFPCYLSGHGLLLANTQEYLSNTFLDVCLLLYCKVFIRANVDVK